MRDKIDVDELIERIRAEIVEYLEEDEPADDEIDQISEDDLPDDDEEMTSPPPDETNTPVQPSQAGLAEP